MKYIVTVTNEGCEEIFLFPRTVLHNIMAESISAMLDRNQGDWKRISRKPVSAGFVEGGKCVGESESLGLRSRPQDSELLSRY